MTTIGEETLLRRTNLFEPHPRTGGDSNVRAAWSFSSKTACIQQLWQISRGWDEIHSRLENANDRYFIVIWTEICTKNPNISKRSISSTRPSTFVLIAS